MLTINLPEIEGMIEKEYKKLLQSRTDAKHTALGLEIWYKQLIEQAGEMIIAEDATQVALIAYGAELMLLIELLNKQYKRYEAMVNKVGNNEGYSWDKLHDTNIRRKHLASLGNTVRFLVLTPHRSEKSTPESRIVKRYEEMLEVRTSSDITMDGLLCLYCELVKKAGWKIIEEEKRPLALVEYGAKLLILAELLHKKAEYYQKIETEYVQADEAYIKDKLHDISVLRAHLHSLGHTVSTLIIHKANTLRGVEQ